jgi:hypothetical protein
MSDPIRNERVAADIARQARRLLAEGTSGDEELRQAGTAGHALAVAAPDGRFHSWFVPVTVGDRLAAFFQFLPDGTLMRFSSFPRRSKGFAGYPMAADWLDPNRVRAHAEPQRRIDETIGEPWLTFDRSPDRLVWAVPLTDANGTARLIYDAGGAVYMPPSEDTFG